uniref:Uncharacterized protein n=1 Tax=Hirsutella rhossiliensis TaxID=111463 RepID=A0A3G4R727_9HYPO|nr:hypothetical protein [Hirsutella rhossiliensis]
MWCYDLLGPIVAWFVSLVVVILDWDNWLEFTLNCWAVASLENNVVTAEGVVLLLIIGALCWLELSGGIKTYIYTILFNSIKTKKSRILFSRIVIILLSCKIISIIITRNIMIQIFVIITRIILSRILFHLLRLIFIIWVGGAYVSLWSLIITIILWILIYIRRVWRLTLFFIWIFLSNYRIIIIIW